MVKAGREGVSWIGCGTAVHCDSGKAVRAWCYRDWMMRLTLTLRMIVDEHYFLGSISIHYPVTYLMSLSLLSLFSKILEYTQPNSGPELHPEKSILLLAQCSMLNTHHITIKAHVRNWLASLSLNTKCIHSFGTTPFILLPFSTQILQFNFTIMSIHRIIRGQDREYQFKYRVFIFTLNSSGITKSPAIPKSATLRARYSDNGMAFWV